MAVLGNPWLVAALTAGAGYSRGMAQEREKQRQEAFELSKMRLGQEWQQKMFETKENSDTAEARRARWDADTAWKESRTASQQSLDDIKREKDAFTREVERARLDLKEREVAAKEADVERKKNKKDEMSATEKQLQKEAEVEGFVSKVPEFVELVKRGQLSAAKVDAQVSKLNLWDNPVVASYLYDVTPGGKAYKKRLDEKNKKQESSLLGTNNIPEEGATGGVAPPSLGQTSLKSANMYEGVSRLGAGEYGTGGLGFTPSSVLPGAARSPAAAPTPAKKMSYEEAVQYLVARGMTREEAIAQLGTGR